MPSSELQRGSWLSTLRFTSILTTAFLPVYSVFSIIGNFYNIVYVVLQIYIAMISILCLFAELRFIAIIRRLVYPLMKWVYFITHHEGRAIVYFFFSLLMLGRKTLFNIIFATIFFGLAVLWPVLNKIYDFDYPTDHLMAELIVQTRVVSKRFDKATPIIITESSA
ncbi:hypothetical protein XU18_4313 [Perkinsela sp. CCAP 1560/4]|nr:hypothetical protein XU18_4313 [Perkinsela sp. CCAP 1560/4]|eukprot:KNH04454.1 hypothetical protein XU18_4313 [Perkinsela sp. CCAP 1560/4]